MTRRDQTLARLDRVERAIRAWDAYRAGTGPAPEGLGRGALLSLRAMLREVLGEMDAAERERLVDRRN